MLRRLNPGVFGLMLMSVPLQHLVFDRVMIILLSGLIQVIRTLPSLAHMRVVLNSLLPVLTSTTRAIGR